MEFIQFIHPFTCMVSGPTSSGKTVLVRDILKNYKLLTNIKANTLNVLWCYGQWQPLYNIPISNVKIDYISGLPFEDEMSGHHIIVIDDLMTELGNSKKLSELFTKGSHHNNISVIFITQNLFYQASQMRTIHLNCHYIILMKSPRGKAQLIHFTRDVFPGKQKLILSCYDDATCNPYSYLRIDLTQNTPNKYRITSNLIPTQKGFQPTVYCIQNES